MQRAMWCQFKTFSANLMLAEESSNNKKKTFGKGQVGVSRGRAEAVVTLSRVGGGGIATSRGSLLLQSLPKANI